MKNWGTLAVTNVLLLIIAIFMLIILIQSSPSPTKRYHLKDPVSGMGQEPGMDESMGSPHGDMGEMPSDDSGGGPEKKSSFNFQNMANAALKCPSDGTISLADAGCKGDEAKERRDFVNGLTAQNTPPRILFDKVIEKYGEGALTDEALEIRKSNRSR